PCRSRSKIADSRGTSWRTRITPLRLRPEGSTCSTENAGPPVRARKHSSSPVWDCRVRSHPEANGHPDASPLGRRPPVRAHFPPAPPVSHRPENLSEHSHNDHLHMGESLPGVYLRSLPSGM